MAPKINFCAKINKPREKKYNLVKGFVSSENKHEVINKEIDEELQLTNKEQIFLISHILACMPTRNIRDNDFLKSPLLVWQSKDFYLQLLDNIKKRSFIIELSSGRF